MKRWRVSDTKILYEDAWVRMKQDRCEIGDSTLNYSYMQRVDEGPLIIPEEDGKLWMVRQYRHPIREIIWQFPAEGVHEGESWEEAAQRGLKEEVQKEAGVLIDLGRYFPDPGGLQQEARVFLARELQDNTNHSLDEHEELERKAFIVDDIREMVREGVVRDGWTLAGLYLYDEFVRGEQP